MLNPGTPDFAFRFPNARKKAVVISFDDGSEHDRRLVDILNAYGLRGTFHLNSARLGADYHIRRDEVGTLYDGHEVSCHARNHRDLTALSDHDARIELETDRRDLESLTEYPVRGLSYPFGTYDDRVVSLVSDVGMAYARTGESVFGFAIPHDLLRLPTTCHHNRMAEFVARLIDSDAAGMELMIVWGHSFELDGFLSSDPAKDWGYMEDACRRLHACPAIWSATTIEIADYLKALRRVEASRSDALITNPTAVSVWLHIHDRDIELPPGGAVDLTDAPGVLGDGSAS